MQQIIAQIHQNLARIFLLGLLIQFYLASAPLFGLGLSFQPHRMLGFTLAGIAILFPILAFAGRLGRRAIAFSALLVALTIVQGMLPALRSSIPVIASIHPLNALVLMRVSAILMRQAPAEALEAELSS